MLLSNKKTWTMFNLSLASVRRRRMYVVLNYVIAAIVCGYIASLGYENSPRFIFIAAFIVLSPPFFTAGEFVKSFRPNADIKRSDAGERNEVHYIAYGKVRQIMLGSALAYGILCLLPEVDQAKIHNITLGALWFLAYVVVSLPRDLVLWHSSEAEET